MKKLFLAAVLVVGLTTFAQDKPKGEPREKMTPEQQVELQVKKLKLDLDLNDNQSAEIKKIVTEQMKQREAKREEMKAKREKGEKPTSKEMFEMKSKMLDEQMVMKEKMKKILTPEQLAKWEKIKSERKDEMMKKAREMRGERKKGMEAPESK